MAFPKSEMILDPEALLLFSAGFARYDQRLYDLILDWQQIHSAQINIQRLKALHAKAEWKDTDSLGYMCAVIAESDPVRWRKTAEGFSGKAVKRQAVLFRDRENEPEKFFPRQDPLALRAVLSGISAAIRIKYQTFSQKARQHFSCRCGGCSAFRRERKPF